MLCNPPYVALGDALPRDVAAHEPAGALYAGIDGLDDYRTIVPLLSSQIAPGGMAAIEIGCDQGRAVLALLEGAALGGRIVRDLAGHDRCVVVPGR